MITELICKSLGGIEGTNDPMADEFLFTFGHTTVQVLIESMADGNYVSVYDNRFRGRSRQKVFLGDNWTADQLKTFLDLVGAK